MFSEFVEWFDSGDKLKNFRGRRFKILNKAYKYFKRFDADDNGVIDRQEFELLCRELGMQNKVEQGWRKLDADGSGGIEFVEFLNWLNWLD